MQRLGKRHWLFMFIGGVAVANAPAKTIWSMLACCCAACLQAGLVSTLQPAMRWWLGTRGPIMREEEVYDAWYHLAPSCPQLYLYSDTDAIVPSAEVERYMQVQVRAGCSLWPFTFGAEAAAAR